MARIGRWLSLAGLIGGGCLLPEATLRPGNEPQAQGGETTLHGDGGENAGGATPEPPQGGEPNAGAPSSPACKDDELRCSSDMLETCKDGVFEASKRCVSGTCNEKDGSCTTACAADGSDCDSGVCLRIGVCEPPLLTLKGYVQHWDSTGLVFEKDVDVTASNLIPDQPTASSNDEGAYEIRKIPPAALLDLEVYWAAQTAAVTLPPALRTTLSSARAKVAKAADGYEVKVNVPVVPFNWLAQVAVDCGIFADLDTALRSASNPKAINPFWVQRSTVLVEVRNEQHEPVAGLGKDDIEVVLSGHSNKDHGDNDVDANPAQVCFLESSKSTPSQLVGNGKLTASSSAGRFVVFRLRNADTATGDGVADVRVSGFPPVSVSLLSSGNIGVVAINPGDVPDPKPRTRNFETDILPLLDIYGCTGCHSQKGPNMALDGAGFEKSPARGPKKLHADYGGTADEVYAVLTAADQGVDCTDPKTPQRICIEKPEASLLGHKPLKEIGEQDHPTTAFRKPDDADYRAIVEWIEQGAKR